MDARGKAGAASRFGESASPSEMSGLEREERTAHISRTSRNH
jgi:hypothetical protein